MKIVESLCRNNFTNVILSIFIRAIFSAILATIYVYGIIRHNNEIYIKVRVFNILPVTLLFLAEITFSNDVKPRKRMRPKYSGGIMSNVKKFHQSSRAKSNLFVSTLSVALLLFPLKIRGASVVLVSMMTPWRTVRSEILPTSTQSQHCPARSSPRKSRERPSPSDRHWMSNDIRRDIRIESTRANRGRIRRSENGIGARSAIYSESCDFLYICYVKRNEEGHERGARAPNAKNFQKPTKRILSRTNG